MKYYSLKGAAKTLGVNRITLWRWMREVGFTQRRLTRPELVALAKRHRKIVMELHETLTLEQRVSRLEQLLEKLLDESHIIG